MTTGHWILIACAGIVWGMALAHIWRWDESSRRGRALSAGVAFGGLVLIGSLLQFDPRSAPSIVGAVGVVAVAVGTGVGFHRVRRK